MPTGAEEVPRQAARNELGGRIGDRVRTVDQRTLQAAAEACAAPRDQSWAAKDHASAVYDRLQASPDTIEYRIEWTSRAGDEAAAAWTCKQAADAYHGAGGYAPDTDE